MKIAIMITFSQRANCNNLLNGKMKRFHLHNGFNFHLISQEIYFAIFTENAINIFPIGNQAKNIRLTELTEMLSLFIYQFS